MRDYLTIGPTPCDEACEQVGTTNYNPDKATAECLAYRNQIRRVFGEEKGDAQLTIKGFPHDFGVYHEVVCCYTDSNELSVQYAYDVECGCEKWDEQAKEELRAKGYL